MSDSVGQEFLKSERHASLPQQQQYGAGDAPILSEIVAIAEGKLRSRPTALILLHQDEPPYMEFDRSFSADFKKSLSRSIRDAVTSSMSSAGLGSYPVRLNGDSEDFAMTDDISPSASRQRIHWMRNHPSTHDMYGSDDASAHHSAAHYGLDALDDHFNPRSRRQRLSPPKKLIIKPARQSNNQPQDFELVRLGDDAKVFEVVDRLITDFQQLNFKQVLKEWIKAMEPKKQANYPYRGKKKNSDSGSNQSNDATKAPPWWPPGVDHKEPDHSSKADRIKLGIHILFLYRNEKLQPEAYKGHHHQWVPWLKSATDPLKERAKHITENPKKRQEWKDKHWPILENLYDLVHQREQYETGERDADTLVPVMPKAKSTRLTSKKRDASPTGQSEQSSKRQCPEPPSDTTSDLDSDEQTLSSSNNPGSPPPGIDIYPPNSAVDFGPGGGHRTHPSTATIISQFDHPHPFFDPHHQHHQNPRVARMPHQMSAYHQHNPHDMIRKPFDDIQASPIDPHNSTNGWQRIDQYPLGPTSAQVSSHGHHYPQPTSPNFHPPLLQTSTSHAPHGDVVTEGYASANPMRPSDSMSYGHHFGQAAFE